jgi:alkylation response protein AidB-like acyl-CoA dehydrogenase
MRAAEDAMQIHGAYSCSDEYDIGRYWRDAKFMQTIEGSNEIHRTLVAEYELGYR